MLSSVLLHLTPVPLVHGSAVFVDLMLEQDSNLPLRRGVGGGVERLTGVSLTNPLPETPSRYAALHPDGLVIEGERRGEETVKKK